jgi:hypothetical protein
MSYVDRKNKELAGIVENANRELEEHHGKWVSSFKNIDEEAVNVGALKEVLEELGFTEGRQEGGFATWERRGDRRTIKVPTPERKGKRSKKAGLLKLTGVVTLLVSLVIFLAEGGVLGLLGSEISAYGDELVQLRGVSVIGLLAGGVLIGIGFVLAAIQKAYDWADTALIAYNLGAGAAEMASRVAASFSYDVGAIDRQLEEYSKSMAIEVESRKRGMDRQFLEIWKEQRERVKVHHRELLKERYGIEVIASSETEPKETRRGSQGGSVRRESEASVSTPPRARRSNGIVQRGQTGGTRRPSDTSAATAPPERPPLERDRPSALREGVSVKIVGGPFAGSYGIVEEVRPNGVKVRANAGMFRTVFLSRSQVRIGSPPKTPRRPR